MAITKDILYECPKAGIKVRLKVTSEIGGMFKRVKSQVIEECDLKNSGGCLLKMYPAEDTKCPAVKAAEKKSLK